MQVCSRHNGTVNDSITYWASPDPLQRMCQVFQKCTVVYDDQFGQVQCPLCAAEEALVKMNTIADQIHQNYTETLIRLMNIDHQLTESHRRLFEMKQEIERLKGAAEHPRGDGTNALAMARRAISL